MLALAVALAATAATAAAYSPAQCAAIPAGSRAPCGQQSDTPDLCTTRGCCYDASDARTPCYYGSAPAVKIDTVHVVQASHFDAGFLMPTSAILSLWWYTHFPRAAVIGAALEANATSPGSPRLRFMTQSWIVSLFLDCPPGIPNLRCPNATEVAAVQESIAKGWLTWHAYPFNAELELSDYTLLAAGVQLTHVLDDATGQRRKTVLSQRDVPGMTRAVLTTLLGEGVRGVTVGVNGASTPPTVPRAFLWADPKGNTPVPALWHPYGYGWDSSSGVGPYEDAVIIPGFNQALVMSWRGDNAGPYDTPEQAVVEWGLIADTFPGATIIASTFDDWWDAMLPAISGPNANILPTLSNEIGDTWLHGVPSDPQKAAWMTRAGVLRAQCLAGRLPGVTCSPSDPAFANFTRLLLKNTEHTWGLDVKTWLHDAVNWSNEQLALAIAQGDPNFLAMVTSWNEQRDYGIWYAIEALGEHPLAALLQEAWDALTPPPPPASPAAAGFSPLEPGAAPISTGAVTIGFDASTGAISTLIDEVTGHVWSNASASSALSLLEYHTYDGDDYVTFINAYYCCGAQAPPPDWFRLDFGKPNVSLAAPVHSVVHPSLVSAWYRKEASGQTVTFLTELTFPALYHTTYGAPESIWVTYSVPTPALPSRHRGINVTVASYNKTATRLPEALFWRLNATSSNASSWNYESVGMVIDPTTVVDRGNSHYHGVDSGGVQQVEPDGTKMTAVSYDAPVATFGKPSGFPTPTTLTAADIAAGLHSDGFGFMLTNNLWGTNYVMWSPFNAEDASMSWSFAVMMA